MKAPSPGYKSKTLATWVALLGGSLGLHRFYLYGFRDLLGWLHPWPTLVGVLGVQRMLEFGQDDRAAWVMIPLLGLMLSISMLAAILYGLTSDEAWNARFNPGGPAHQTGWVTIIGVIISLMVGAGILMATIAFSMQRYFEVQIEEARKISQ